MPGDYLEVDETDANYLKTAIEKFLWHLSGEVNDLSPPSELSCGIDGENELIHIETEDSEAVVFNQIPSRPDQSFDVVDICIQFGLKVAAREIDGVKHFEIQKSKTNILYIDTSEGRRYGEIESGFRFEFSTLPQADHPVFHTHYDTACISSEFLNDEYELDLTTQYSREYPRVPSAPMDITSVILLVLHDHQPSILNREEGWPPSTTSTLEKIPKFPATVFDPEPQGGKGMICDWWYRHQSPQNEGVFIRKVPDCRLHPARRTS